MSGEVKVVFETTLGDIPATLDADATPCTVNSFVSLAEQGFFDDSPCPRMATSPSFGILQCGDPSGTGSGGPGYSYADELTGEETYNAGTLAMANAGAGHQRLAVLLRVQRLPGLTANYNVFGTVDPAGLKLLTDAAKKGDDGSHPAGGGVPNAGPIDITVRHDRLTLHSGQLTPVSDSDFAHNALARSGSLAISARPTGHRRTPQLRRSVRPDIGVAGDVHGRHEESRQRAALDRHPDQPVAHGADAVERGAARADLDARGRVAGMGAHGPQRRGPPP